MKIKQTLFTVLMLIAPALWAAEADAARIVFTSGSVQVGGSPAKLGAMVKEGQSLTTQQDGYLYLETLDKGFFILRPNSAGQIVTYQIDPVNPANTRIKLELQSGVARHISGTAVQSARHNFRFNTPVAAVGVRGTDFTISASPDTTRITVLSGGVIVSPLSATCTAGGFGPCEGMASRELFANKVGQMLQIAKGLTPSLIINPEQTPDTQAPPRADEASTIQSKPKAASGADSSSAAPLKITLPLADQLLDPLKVNLTSQITGTVDAPATPQFIWGRWQAVLDKTIEVDVAAYQATHQLLATNAYYALMRSQGATWQAPITSTLGFSLSQSQAMVTNEATRQVTPAKIENAQLTLDFAKSSFFTKFDLLTGAERFTLQNQGEVASDGRLYGGNAFLAPSNMDVRGALATDNTSAAYLFQARLDAQRIATGATLWGK
jgi:hypothetical protein